MSLDIVSEESIASELNVQMQLNDAIDACQHVLFNAGAGAGKTYALIESLKYIIQTRGKSLKYHNQHIICITYTNVATNEIKNRLGNSDLVKVATIHERLWELIKDYQLQILEIHKENLQKILDSQQFDLRNNVQDPKVSESYNKFRSLSEAEQANFVIVMLENKEIFYKVRDKSSKVIKDNFMSLLENQGDILKNVANFKKIVSTIYKIENFKNCLKEIKNNNHRYQTIRYDSKYNSDVLHKMIISHDTLLNYALKIISRHDILKQIIIHKYPYILIDEFQDANEDVVKIITSLANYAITNKDKFFIGYFGDAAQNIYDGGVGDKINSLHPNLQRVYKKYNRRSTQEIIDIINKIRNDGIRQESIFEDNIGGSVGFQLGIIDEVNAFIQRYILEWKINKGNKLHCLVLTNKRIAQYNGFSNLYDNFSSAEIYSGINYKKINSELLSNDLTKLGIIPNLFYRIISFKKALESQQTILDTVLKYELYEKLTFSELGGLVEILKSISGSTLKEYLDSLFQKFHDTENACFKRVIESHFRLQDVSYTYEGFFSYLIDELYPNIEDNEIDVTSSKLNQLLTINFEEFYAWYSFINETSESDVIYHTYHGTKGEEYDNVIILMENSFGLDKNKFSAYFTNYDTTEILSEDELVKFQNTRNLLYVSCSRAIKNLRVLYLDDISNFRSGVEKIFNTVSDFGAYS